MITSAFDPIQILIQRHYTFIEIMSQMLINDYIVGPTAGTKIVF